jgi:hypothetical protein
VTDFDDDVEGQREQSYSVYRISDLQRYYYDDGCSLQVLPNGTLFGGGDFENDRAAAAREDAEAFVVEYEPPPLPTNKSPSLVCEWLSRTATEHGYALEELVRTVRRGRVPGVDRDRHNLLCALIAYAREADVTLDVLGAAIGKNRQTVVGLVRLGGSLRRPCRGHDAWKEDCPGCRRAAYLDTNRPIRV